MESPYKAVPTKNWPKVTRRLVEEHPLQTAEIVDVVLNSWASIFSSGIGPKPFKIGQHIFPKPQIMGFLLHELIPLELANRYPKLWRTEVSSKDKDIVILGEGADGSFGNSLHNSLFFINKFRMLLKFQIFNKILRYSSPGFKKGQSLATIIDKKNVPIDNENNIVWSLGAYGSLDWDSKYFMVEKKEIFKGRYKIVKKYEDRSIYDIISLLSLFGEGAATQSIWSKLGESQDKIVFYPYTNFNLLNYIFSVPWNIKLKKSKYILRNVAHQLNIPGFIIKRPKSSFGVQPEIWSVKKGTFESLVSIAMKVFDEKEIRRMQSSDVERAMTYWNILNYSIWKRLIIRNEPLEILLSEL